MSPVIYTPPTPHKCDRPYVAREQPQIHIVPAHPEGTLWQCDVCGAVWRVQGRGLSDHARRAGHTALSTEWIRLVAGDDHSGLSDDLVEHTAHAVKPLLLDVMVDHDAEEAAWDIARVALTAALTPKEKS